MIKTIFDLVKIKITGGVTSMISFMRGREAKTTGFSFGTALILSIVIIAFLFMMVFSFGLAMVVGFQMAMNNCLWLYYPLAFVVSTVFAFVGTVFAAQSYLFESEDNEAIHEDISDNSCYQCVIRADLYYARPVSQPEGFQ